MTMEGHKLIWIIGLFFILLSFSTFAINASMQNSLYGNLTAYGIPNVGNASYNNASLSTAYFEPHIDVNSNTYISNATNQFGGSINTTYQFDSNDAIVSPYIASLYNATN